MFNISEAWKNMYPGASIGVLVMRSVTNPEKHPALQDHKEVIEEYIRSQYADHTRQTLREIPVLGAYAAYYKKFNKTYHVQHQIESIAFKDKTIPNVAALVEAMFIAELKNLLLTAGHDLDKIQQPVSINVSDGSESYTRLNGQDQILKPTDMYIADQEGVLSSIIYGPDQRTKITAETTNVLFTVYAPVGIEQDYLRGHLEDIEANVKIITPDAELEMLEVYRAE